MLGAMEPELGPALGKGQFSLERDQAHGKADSVLTGGRGRGRIHGTGRILALLAPERAGGWKEGAGEPGLLRQVPRGVPHVLGHTAWGSW